MSRRMRDIDLPPAGAASGSGSLFMDGNKKIGGLVGDTLRRPQRSAVASDELLGTKMSASGEMVRTMFTGDSSDAEVRARSPGPNHMVGGHPRVGATNRQKGCIPGYSGHLAGKVAENVHGGTFASENDRSMKGLPVREMRRTLSAPDHLAAHLDSRSDSKAMKVPSRVPGYTAHIPGKLSETVHGCRFSEANESAQGLRNYNPHVSCEGWIRSGEWPVDRRATYKFTGKVCQADFMPHFTTPEEQRAMESNRKLGHTFGLKTTKQNPYKPGDRYMQIFAPSKKARADSSSYAAAGTESHSTKLDPARWLVHNTLGLGNGNQRTAY